MSSGGAGVLKVISLVARVAATVLAFLVVVLCFTTGSGRTSVLSSIIAFANALPTASMTALSVETPFGGVFKGDFCLVSVILFIVDWACGRAAASARRS